MPTPPRTAPPLTPPDVPAPTRPAPTRPAAVAHTDQMTWQPSPSATVWRKRLELFGDPERGQVTSVVRYDPDSRFPSHGHPRGEEILVLDGVFSDEHGDYPAGSYLLNPPGFAHAPFSRGGCVLFVKLCQYAGDGRRHVAVDTRAAAFQPAGDPGVHVLSLYDQPPFPDRMALWRVDPGARLPGGPRPGGEEIFVVSGDLSDDARDAARGGPDAADDARGGPDAADDDARYRAGSWLRMPPGTAPDRHTTGGCLLYVKRGHLTADA